MKIIFILMLLLLGATLLASCVSVTIKNTDPETGIINEVIFKGVRRVAISTKDTTVIAGQVLINDETVQVLGKEVAKIK